MNAGTGDADADNPNLTYDPATVAPQLEAALQAANADGDAYENLRAHINIQDANLGTNGAYVETYFQKPWDEAMVALRNDVRQYAMYATPGNTTPALARAVIAVLERRMDTAAQAADELGELTNNRDAIAAGLQTKQMLAILRGQIEEVKAWVAAREAEVRRGVASSSVGGTIAGAGAGGNGAGLDNSNPGSVPRRVLYTGPADARTAAPNNDGVGAIPNTATQLADNSSPQVASESLALLAGVQQETARTAAQFEHAAEEADRDAAASASLRAALFFNSSRNRSRTAVRPGTTINLPTGGNGGRLTVGQRQHAVLEALRAEDAQRTAVVRQATSTLLAAGTAQTETTNNAMAGPLVIGDVDAQPPGLAAQRDVAGTGSVVRSLDPELRQAQAQVVENAGVAQVDGRAMPINNPARPGVDTPANIDDQPPTELARDQGRVTFARTPDSARRVAEGNALADEIAAAIDIDTGTPTPARRRLPTGTTPDIDENESPPLAVRRGRRQQLTADEEIEEQLRLADSRIFPSPEDDKTGDKARRGMATRTVPYDFRIFSDAAVANAYRLTLTV